MYPSGLDTDETTVAMLSFDTLEKAGIPREWTGRVYKALRADDHPINVLDRVEDSAQAISDAMRPMTNDQRETFLALLPEWTESLDDLVNAVKTF
jgi:hypothetical protein